MTFFELLGIFRKLFVFFIESARACLKFENQNAVVAQKKNVRAFSISAVISSLRLKKVFKYFAEKFVLCKFGVF